MAVALRYLAAGLGLAAVGLAGAVAVAAPPPDANRGKTLFSRCAICHSMNPADKRLGPTLKGVVGRKSGTVAGYAYSPAMKAANLTWTAKELDAYLADARKKVPGTKMVAPPMPNPADRADVIAFLAANR